MFGLVGPKENSTEFRYLRNTLERFNANLKETEDMLGKAYFLDRGIYDKDLENALRESLGEKFHKMLAIIKPSQERKLTDAMKPGPMTSLRDVDRGVPFKPESGDPFFLLWFRKDMD